MRDEPRVDWPIFAAALFVLSSVCALLMLFPEDSGEAIKFAYAGITTNFGVVYLWGGVAVLAF